ncbi:GerMN domain-containing protein [Treponema sp.]|uniref:GerMN domain-containing protein n=1 Tax=Treponema sp. TaxID=166 RepID=UPI003F041345
MNSRKKNIVALAFAGVFFGSLIVSGVSFCFYRYHWRQIFYFESYESSRICTETRYAEKKKGNDAVRFFVDELLLGPMTNRVKFLFSPGTRTEFCFLSGKNLYLGFTADALFVNSETFNMKKSVSLLHKNIMKNFKNIDRIYLYIDGKPVLWED